MMNEKPKRRLSELIRAGAAIRPQGFGQFFKLEARGVTSCALGAAYEAHFARQAVNSIDGAEELGREFPILLRRVRYPLVKDDNLIIILSGAILALNDAALWTREQIADFVEEIEAEEAAKEMQVNRFLAQRNPEPVLA